MAFDSNYSDIYGALTGANAGETTTGGTAAGVITEQDWQYNSPYLAFQSMISSGPYGDNQLNISAQIGGAAAAYQVKAGMVFSISAGVAVLGVPTKVEGALPKMPYVCIRGVDTRDSRTAGAVMGVPATAGVEIVTTCFDATLQDATPYIADDALYAEYTSSAFTGRYTKDTSKVKDYATGNAPIVGIVSPGMENNSFTKVGDPTNISGAGYMEIPYLRLFPIFDTARGVAVPSV